MADRTPSMHRILLYALVIGLVYLSWSSRRGPEDSSSGTGTDVAASSGAPVLGPQPAATDAALARGSHGFGLQRRLEGRIEPLDAGSGAGVPVETSAAAAPPPEQSFTEWLGRENARAGSEALAVLTGMADRSSAEGADPSNGARATEESEPFFVVSLALVESLNSNLPPWSGLLDLELERAAIRGHERDAGEDLRAPQLETAWLSDEHGVLIARVSALDGMGLLLDPSWPWMPRARRLMLSPMGSVGFSARQYRIVLYSSTPGRTWTGRLVLIAAPRAQGSGGGR